MTMESMLALLLVLYILPTEQANLECRTSKNGEKYNGTQSRTISGEECLAWNDTLPLPPTWDIPGNLCRNNDNDTNGPWCFVNLTASPPHEYCPVPFCDVSDGINDIYEQVHYISQIKTSSDYEADSMILIFAPIIIVIGTICNAFSIALFSWKYKTSKTSTRKNTVFLFLTLAICDILSLNIGAWVKWMNAVFRKTGIAIFIGASNDVSCQIYHYIYIVTITFSVWVLVLINIERTFGVINPMQVHFYFTKKISCYVLAVVLVCLCLLNLPVLIYYEQSIHVRYAAENTDVFSQCISSEPRIDTVQMWIDSFMRVLVPFIIMLVSNIIIIVTLVRNNKSKIVTANVDIKHLTTMLLCASFAHIILTLPSVIHFVGGPILDMIDKDTYVIWSRVMLCLLYVDYSVNFLLYCLSGKKIRKEFFDMMRIAKVKASQKHTLMRRSIYSRDSSGATDSTYLGVSGGTV